MLDYFLICYTNRIEKANRHEDISTIYVVFLYVLMHKQPTKPIVIATERYKV